MREGGRRDGERDNAERERFACGRLVAGYLCWSLPLNGIRPGRTTRDTQKTVIDSMTFACLAVMGVTSLIVNAAVVKAKI